MLDDKARYYVLLMAGLLFTGMLLAIQPYSVTSPWHIYDHPARSYLEAATHRDSVTVARHASAPEAVQWALKTSQTQPESLSVWAHEATAWAGHQLGDTTDVFLGTRRYQCTLVLRFVGVGPGAKVQQAHSDCLGPR
jgi:hypothetical protein